MYDVIVVGAGPSGSAAAYYLAHAGAHVLLIDRFEFPRDKACGDAIMPPAIQELEQIGVINLIHDAYPITHITRSDTINNPIGNPAGGYTIPRLTFDAILQKHACVQNTCVWMGGMTVLSYHNDGTAISVMLRDNNLVTHTFKAQLLLAADGSQSRIANQARKEMAEKQEWYAIPFNDGKQQGWFTALRAYYDIDADHRPQNTLQFFFPRDFIHYYWMFPLTQNRWNVGWIATLSRSRSHKPGPKLLDMFLRTLAIKHPQRLQWKAAPIRTGLRNTALYSDRVLVIGDAAGLPDPWTAEGISGALWSGRQAADVALRALEKGDFSSQKTLWEYAERVRQKYFDAYKKA